MATSPTTPPRPTPIAASSIETLLLREKLVTPDQIAHAMTVQVATGKSIEEVVRENGWVSETDLARLVQHVNPHAEPTPAVVEEPEAPQVVDLPVVAPFPSVVPEPVQQVSAPELVQPVVAPEPEPAPAPRVVVPQPEPVVPQVVVPEPVEQVVEPEPVPEVVVPQPVHTVPVPEPVQPVAAPEPVQPEPVPAPAAVQPVAAPAPVEPVVTTPEPVELVVAAPEPVETEQPAASPALQVHVMLRLTNGERIQMASFEEKDAARQFALELSRELALSADWPFIGGRFVRPEAVVSIDIDLTAF
jgi:hypothetical protein